MRRKFFHEGIQELEEDLRRNPNPVSHDTSGGGILVVLKRLEKKIRSHEFYNIICLLL